MKINIVRVIIGIGLLATCILIFCFSNQQGEKSSNTSSGVIKKIIDIFPFTSNLEEEQKEQLQENLQPIVRKLAHFSIYTLLGIEAMSLLATYSISNKIKIVGSLVFGFLYACSDEFHQYFIPGRSAEFRDVLIDTSRCDNRNCIGIYNYVYTKNMEEKGDTGGWEVKEDI